MEEENVIIRIKDIIKYLEQFNPETRVELDRDGWGDDCINNENRKEEIIQQAGIFDTILYDEEDPVIIINN